MNRKRNLRRKVRGIELRNFIIWEAFIHCVAESLHRESPLMARLR